MMRRCLGLFALGVLIAVAALSSGGKPATENATTTSGDLVVRLEDRNPWNHLRLNNDPADFQFAIVSDRTGGHREKVFSVAVEQLNLLQPEFVLSVGDLIEGGKTDAAKLADEWKEFEGFVNRLHMPFFYVPGNHDLSNMVQETYWRDKFGRRYYHFVYRNVLFLILNTEDPPGGSSGRLSEAQIHYAKKVLEENPKVRWTIVALHKPIWNSADAAKGGWLEVENALKGRKYTVFAGHVHRYQKFVRNDMSYYQLATTGGSSKMRGTRYGEFDHLVWVTMKNTGPVLANILLDGILPEDLRRPDTMEPAAPRTTKPTHPVKGTVTLDGQPISDAYIVFTQVDGGARPLRADSFSDDTGGFTLTTYRANDGAPADEYKVTVVLRRPITPGGVDKPALPAKYASVQNTPLSVRVREGANEVKLELTSK